MSSWHEVPGTFSTDVEADEIPDFLEGILTADYYEIVVEFESSGYDDPGKFCGPPEDCYPPEGWEEREWVRVYAEDEDNNRVEFDDETSKLVFDYYYDQIMEVELEGGYEV